MFNQDNRHTDTVDTLEQVAENAGRYLRKLLDENPTIETGVESLATAIRNEPVKASLITLGIGLVLGHIFRRH